MTRQLKQPKSPRLKVNQEGFSIISEPLRSDYTLNAMERALMFTLLTASPNFKPTIRGLAKLLQVAPGTISKTTKSLKNRGYLIIKNPGTKQATWEIYQKPNYELRKHPYEALRENVIAIVGAMRSGDIDALLKDGYLSREERQKLYQSVCDLAKLKWLDEE